MPKFRKLPVVIEAHQVPPIGVFPPEEFLAFTDDSAFTTERDGELTIETLEGRMKVSPGGWIIKGVKGEYYPCKPDIFAATYELVEDH